MTQDKNKLSEVGLEPDKPKGHIRAVWAITLILAFAIVIGGGVYFILWYSPWGENVMVNKSTTTPTPSSSARLSGSPSSSSRSTTKYKTYTNSAYKFSFEYPENLYVYPDFVEYGGTISILKKGNDNVLSATKIQIKLNYLGSKTTDAGVAYKEVYKSDFVDDSIRRVTSLTVAGVPALKDTYTDAEDMGYYFVHSDFLYSIFAYMSRMSEDTSPLADKDNKAAFDHIVSSFKFL